MTIEIDEKSYIVGMWFAHDPETENDWLACVIKDPENPKRYKCWSRFRYVADDKIWNSKDKKSWYDFVSPENLTDDDMIQLIELMQNCEQAYSYKDKIIVKGDLHKLMELAKDKPWMNLKQVKVSEHE